MPGNNDMDFLRFQHKHPVKFFLQKGMRDHLFVCHILNIRMAGTVQKIMASEPKQICQKFFIMCIRTSAMPLSKKKEQLFPCAFGFRFWILPVSAYDKTEYPVRDTDPVQIDISSDDRLHLHRKFVINLLTEQIVCIRRRHFIFLLNIQAKLYFFLGFRLKNLPDGPDLQSGSSSSPCTPKQRRNSSVVPRRIGIVPQAHPVVQALLQAHILPVC